LSEHGRERKKGSSKKALYIGAPDVRKTIRKLRRIGRYLAGKDYFHTIDRRWQTARFGSEYGGWNIVTKDIDRSSVVYSFGIGEDASFDFELIGRFGMVVHAFDPTPRSIAWVRRQETRDNFVLHEYGIADFDGEVALYPPENPNYVSHTILEGSGARQGAVVVPVKRLQTIMKELGHDKIDILKMDVEGAEYRIIEDIRMSNIRPTQVLVEFHHRFPNLTIKDTKEGVDKLRGAGYSLIFVSNSGEEFSFFYSLAKNQ
jgi:FkbM family methyltransferase